MIDDSLTGSDIQESTLKGVEGPQGPQGDRGPQGATGPQGPAGSNATINGVAAGGDLSGSFPDPVIGANALGVAEPGAAEDEIADGSVDSEDISDASIDPLDIENTTRSFSIGVSEVSDPVFVRAGDTAPTRTTVGGLMPALGFASGAENAFLLVFSIPTDYVATSGFAVTLRWSGSTSEAAANEVVWGGEVDSVAGLGDVAPPTPELTDTATPVPSTTAERFRTSLLSFPSPSSQITNGDLVVLRVSREVGDASDDYTGIANLHEVQIRYTAAS